MPATVEITQGKLVAVVRGADKVWSLKSRLEIPLEHVEGADRADEEAHRWWHGARAPGTHVPGVLAAGTFHHHGERVFWDVHHPENAIEIRLRDERYARLVIEVTDPDATVSQIEAALPDHSE